MSRHYFLIEKSGKIIPDTKGKSETGKEYIEDLFEDERHQEVETEERNRKGSPDITKQEIVCV